MHDRVTRLGGRNASRATLARYAWTRRTGTRSTRSRRRSMTVFCSSRSRSVPVFYDEVGSQLFGDSASWPEYYLTRASAEILARYADAIAARCPTPLFLAELGSGKARRRRACDRGVPCASRARCATWPVDISQSMLEHRRSAARRLSRPRDHGDRRANTARAATTSAKDTPSEADRVLGSNIGNSRAPMRTTS